MKLRTAPNGRGGTIWIPLTEQKQPQPTAPTANDLVAARRQEQHRRLELQLAEDLQRRLASADTGRVNHAAPPAQKPKEQIAAEIEAEGERRERNRHILR